VGAPESARERVLSTASHLFSSRGLGAVGVNEVIARAGVAKATLYAHFPSKEALVLAHLDRVDRSWREQLRTAAAAAGPEPADQLVGLFDAVSSACARPGFSGCAFLNAAAESRAGDPVHRRVQEHKRAVRTWVADLAAAAGAQDPAAAATMLTVLLDGALSDAALDPADDPARRAREAAALLVDRLLRTV
jgi:AcrR family transcriptional regulator